MDKHTRFILSFALCPFVVAFIFYYFVIRAYNGLGGVSTKSPSNNRLSVSLSFQLDPTSLIRMQMKYKSFEIIAFEWRRRQWVTIETSRATPFNFYDRKKATKLILNSRRDRFSSGQCARSLHTSLRNVPFVHLWCRGAACARKERTNK